MAIYQICAKIGTDDGRMWAAFWKRRAVSQNDACKRAQADIEAVGGQWYRINVTNAYEEDSAHVIGGSGRIMMVQTVDGQRGSAEQVVHFTNSAVTYTSDLTMSESEYVWNKYEH